MRIYTNAEEADNIIIRGNIHTTNKNGCKLDSMYIPCHQLTHSLIYMHSATCILNSMLRLDANSSNTFNYLVKCFNSCCHALPGPMAKWILIFQLISGMWKLNMSMHLLLKTDPMTRFNSSNISLCRVSVTSYSRSQQGSGKGVSERVLSTLLNEMDGIGVRLVDQARQTDSRQLLREGDSSQAPVCLLLKQ